MQNVDESWHRLPKYDKSCKKDAKRCCKKIPKDAKDFQTLPGLPKVPKSVQGLPKFVKVAFG